MEPQARQLMADCVDKNMIDKDDYPRTADRGPRSWSGAAWRCSPICGMPRAGTDYRMLGERFERGVHAGRLVGVSPKLPDSYGPALAVNDGTLG